MLFSFKEFEQTKQYLVRQFEENPPEGTEESNHAMIFEYNKLLNGLKFVNKAKKYWRAHNRSMLKTAKGSRTDLMSATSRNTNDIEHSQRTIKYFVSSRKKKNLHYRSASSKGFSKCEDTNAFYITYLCNFGQNTTREDETYKEKVRESKYYYNEKSIRRSINLSTEYNYAVSHPELLELKVKYLYLSKDEQYLRSYIEYLERSIRYFQKQNNELSYQIKIKYKKYIISFNMALQKQSDLNIVDFNNKDFKERVYSTEKFYLKSLQSIRNNRENSLKKCNEAIEDIAEKILTGKYYYRKIQEQNYEIKKIYHKNQSKLLRIEYNKNMHIYAIIMLKIQNLTNFIKSSEYGDIYGLYSVIKEIESNEKCTLYPEYLIYKTNFVQLAKDLLKLHIKLSKDYYKLRQVCEYRINDLYNTRKSFKYCTPEIYIENENFVSYSDLKTEYFLTKIAKFYPSQFKKEASSERYKMLGSQKRLFKKYSILLEKGRLSTPFSSSKKINAEQEYEYKIRMISNKISQSLIVFENRVKGFVKRNLKFFQTIVEKWLKFDQSSIKFLMESINAFVKAYPKIVDSITRYSSLNVLSYYFYNWKHYAYFIDYLFSNPLINDALNKKDLIVYFKRIIKTKRNYPHVNTSSLFCKFLKGLFQYKVMSIRYRIKFMLSLSMDLYNYFNKNHVVIVNLHEPASSGTSTPSSQAPAPLPKNIQPLLEKVPLSRPRHMKKKSSFVYQFNSSEYIYSDSSIEDNKESMERREKMRKMEEERIKEYENKYKRTMKIGAYDYSVLSIIQDYQREISNIAKMNGVN